MTKIKPTILLQLRNLTKISKLRMMTMLPKLPVT